MIDLSHPGEKWRKSAARSLDELQSFRLQQVVVGCSGPWEEEEEESRSAFDVSWIKLLELHPHEIFLYRMSFEAVYFGWARAEELDW